MSDEVQVPSFFDEQDASDFTGNAAELKEVADLIRKADDLQEQIERAEEELKALKESYRSITEGRIPEILTTNGINSLDVEGIGKVSVKLDYKPSVNKSDMSAFIAWAESIGWGDAVKHKLVIPEPTDEIRASVASLGVAYDSDDTIHPMTMKSMVRKLSEAGQEFPDFVKVFKHYKTKVEKK